MKMNNEQLWYVNENGETMVTGLYEDVNEKHKAEDIFEMSATSTFVMIFCAIVDFIMFYSLFCNISYDSPLIICVGIGGMLFGFDMVPIYLGKELKKHKQKLTKDTVVIWSCIAAFFVAFGLNVVLRMLNMTEMSPDLTSSVSSMYGAIEESTTPEITPTTWSTTLFGMLLPFVTSVGSFAISYFTSDPLKKKQKRLETQVIRSKDRVRRFKAVLSEYEAEKYYKERMLQDDRERYESTLKTIEDMAMMYCDYVRERIKEHIHEPAGLNELSKDIRSELLERYSKDVYGSILKSSGESRSDHVATAENHENSLHQLQMLNIRRNAV